MKTIASGLGLLLAAPLLAGQSTYHVRSEHPVPALAANGYVQQVRTMAPGEYEVRVAAVMAPIGATGTYAEVRARGRRGVPEGFRLPAALARRLAPDLSAWDAATLVISWAADNLEIDDQDRAPQDAQSVLRRGRGRCSGVSNAAVALLMAAGFEARTVSGALVTDEGVIAHRWFECRLPGAGWVPSDPTLGLWAVTSRHLVFADTLVIIPEVRVVSTEEDRLDRLMTRNGKPVRPNRGAGLVCFLTDRPGGPPPVVVLRGPGGEVRRASLDPTARFLDLLPGPWLLEVEHGGGVVDRRQLELRPGALNSLALRVPSGVGGPGAVP